MFLRFDTKSMIHKIKICTSSNFKMSALAQLREWRDRPQSGIKYWQIIHLTKDLYLEYTRNFQNPIIKIKIIFKVKMIWTDTSPKRYTDEKKKSIWENTKYH